MRARRWIESTAVMAALVAATTAPALSALPPYWQSAREISTIVNDPRVHDALKYEEPILSIATEGDDVYILKTPRCTLTVTVIDIPQADPMPGPRQFDIEPGQADCQ